jgi:uncharacterized protein with HEPN domain
MTEADKNRVRHMLDAAREAGEFARGLTIQDLRADRKLSLAIVRCLEIIGEAASRVSDQTRKDFPEVPWQDIVGMRNRLIHAYFDIDHDIIGHTVHNDLPLLIPMLEAILPSRDSD